MGASTGLVGSSFVYNRTGQTAQDRTGQDDRTTPTASRDTNQYAQYTHNSRLRRQDSGRIEYTQKTTGLHDYTTPRQEESTDCSAFY